MTCKMNDLFLPNYLCWTFVVRGVVLDDELLAN